jgi:hypothetical protein
VIANLWKQPQLQCMAAGAGAAEEAAISFTTVNAFSIILSAW